MFEVLVGKVASKRQLGDRIAEQAGWPRMKWRKFQEEKLAQRSSGEWERRKGGMEESEAWQHNRSCVLCDGDRLVEAILRRPQW